jgi:ubiquinone/menaquinone biosynthesis C-methylase UbiE
MQPSERGPNAETVEAWDTVLFDKFCRFRHILTEGLSSHSKAALARFGPPAGASVLDLGCGFGDTTIELGRRVGPAGAATGVDCASRFTAAARQDAVGMANVQFMTGDVQTAHLPGPFEMAFSRFGTMFFANPVAALSNVRSALVSGGLLCMVVWRKREDNAFVHTAELVVRPMMPESVASRAPTCGPGPFSMADADVVTDQLLAAGYVDITLLRNETDICIGRDFEEALEYAMAMGPAGEMLRLAGAGAEAKKPAVRAALGDALAKFVKPHGVYAPSSSWIVTARAP